MLNYILFFVIISVIVLFIIVLKFPTYVALMAVTAITAFYGIAIQKHELKDELKTIIKAGVKAPFPILFAVGALTSSWIISGTVPYLVAQGLYFINPKFFLPVTMIVCLILSAVTGSSWTTCGTVGIAFLGISESLCIPAGMTAGAVLCGAFFGDKLSPLSDFAVSTVQIGETDFRTHIKYMLKTSVPAAIICVIIFFFINNNLQIQTTGDLAYTVSLTAKELGKYFKFTPIVLIPVAVLIVSLSIKISGIISMILSAVSAIIIGIALQNTSIFECILALLRGVNMDISDGLVKTVCNRGGMYSMLGSVLILVFAMTSGAMLKYTGVLTEVASPVRKMVKGRFTLVIATYFIGSLMAFITGSGTIGTVISYNTLNDLYERYKVNNAIFTRSICELITPQQPLVVWGSSGAFVAKCFGLSLSEFAPFYLIGFTLPVLGILSALTGIGSDSSPK